MATLRQSDPKGICQLASLPLRALFESPRVSLSTVWIFLFELSPSIGWKLWVNAKLRTSSYCFALSAFRLPLRHTFSPAPRLWIWHGVGAGTKQGE